MAKKRTNDEELEDLLKCLENNEVLNTGYNTLHYYLYHHQLAQIHFLRGTEPKGIYHLTETHFPGLRQIALINEDSRRIKGTNGDVFDTEPLLFKTQFTQGEEGLLKRLTELPSEWTVVQLTIQPHTLDQSFKYKRQSGTPSAFRSIYLTRLPCGAMLQKWDPLCVRIKNTAGQNENFMNVFLKAIKEMSSTSHPASHNIKVRLRVSDEIESVVREMNTILRPWNFIFVSPTQDHELEHDIEVQVNKTLMKFPKIDVTRKQRYLIHLLASSGGLVPTEEIKEALNEIFPNNQELQIALQAHFQTISTRLMKTTPRHPVILLVDQDLDQASWESIPVLENLPVCRLPSLHLLHYMYRIHKPFIVNGQRLVPEDQVGYLVINPDGNLQTIEKNLIPFIKKRLSSWDSLIGQKPTEKDLLDVLTTRNTFIYCGHGNGCQYLPEYKIVQHRVKCNPLLYGCSSASLNDYGGMAEMDGYVLNYLTAGSVCGLGMLWTVTTRDTDLMTMKLANTWLPGNIIDLEHMNRVERVASEREPELLRAIKHAKKDVYFYANGAALIVRGIPIKLVPRETIEDIKKEEKRQKNMGPPQ